MDQTPVKPHYGAFVLKPLLLLLVPLVIILSVLSLFTPVALALFVVGFFVALGYFAWRHERYRKTQYVFGDEKIRVVTGTYVSDSDKEVLWSKIVLPKRNRGILQRYVFGTATIFLQAAGQAETEIVLHDLTEHEELFDRILENLPAGTHRSGDDHEVRHRQSALGISLDFLLPTVLITLVTLIGTLAAFELINPDPTLGPLKVWLPLGVLGLCTLVFGLVALVKASVVYNVYSDSVERVVDFFWYNQTVVPLSVLSDVNLNEPLHKRILGLSNLSLSVPGVGEETPLVNLTEGQSVRQRLQDRSDELKDRVDDSETTGRGTRFEARPVFLSYTALPIAAVFLSAGLILAVAQYLGVSLTIEQTDLLNVFVAEPDRIVLAFTLPPFLAALAWFLHRVVHYTASTFAVEGNRVELTFSFLNRSVTSLSTDKIKAIVKRQGIIERFFDTYSLIFHSIGTEENIRFFSVKDSQSNAEMLRHIREREGSYGGQSVETVKPSFSRLGLFQNPLVLASSFFLVFLPALALSLYLGSILPAGAGFLLAVISAVGTIGYLQFYYENCVTLDLHSGFLVFREGYFITKEYYVAYHDIRNVKYAREPGSTNGWFTVDFASGGHTEQQQNNNDLGWLIQHLWGADGSFTVQHLNDVDATATAAEDVFSESLSPEGFEVRRAELRERDPDASDRLRATPRGIPYVGIGVFYGLIPLFMVPEDAGNLGGLATMIALSAGGTLGWLYHKTISYTIKEDRVEASHWIVFTRSKSIKYKNIDNIETDQNFLGKILRMGNVKVSTTGGSGVEMTAKYLPDYQSFYRELQDEYSEATTSETI